MTDHAPGQSFFVVNHKILSGTISVNKINDVQFMNYGKERVTGTIIVNSERELGTAVLDEHNRIADLTNQLKQEVVKTLDVIINTGTSVEKYRVIQNLNILEVDLESVINKKYKSAFFYDEVSEGVLGIEGYRVFLSILAHEHNMDDAEMLVDKVSREILSISHSDDDAIEFFLYYAMMSRVPNCELIEEICSKKNSASYRELISLFNYNMDEAEIFSKQVGKAEDDFHYGCFLLKAYLDSNKINVRYYQRLYDGDGILRDILELIQRIVTSDYDSFESQTDYYRKALNPLRQYALLDDICNIVDAYMNQAELTDNAYNHFSRLSPLVCAIKAEHEPDDVLRNKILKSALKRFDDCEWFYEYASASLDIPWADSRITKHMPRIYWSQVAELNAKLEIPYTDSFLEYIRNTGDIEITPLGNSSVAGCSCFVVSAAGYHVMLDCGVFPGKVDNSCYPNFDLWKQDIDAIVISHAHIDHSGSVSLAHQRWPNALIITSPETKAFLEPLLYDMSLEELVKDELDLLPIEKSAAMEAYQSVMPVDFDHWVSISHNLKIRLHPAGHLLGASIVELEMGSSSIVYTGDFSIHRQELCEGAKITNLPRNPDLLICEATYLSDRHDRNWIVQREKLKDAIIQNVKKHKTILLPSTAFGRSQEILCLVADLMRDRDIPPETPVYVGGFSCKTCAAIENLLNQNYTDIMDKSTPLTRDVIPEKGSIIIASSGTMRRSTASYKIAQTIRNRDHKELVVISGGAQDEDGYLISSHSYNDSVYPLSTHAGREDIFRLVSQTLPMNLAFVHWGTEDIQAKESLTQDIRKIKPGNMQTMWFEDNDTFQITDIRKVMKRRLIHE